MEMRHAESPSNAHPYSYEAMSAQRRGRTQAETARISVAAEAVNYAQQTLTSPDRVLEHMRSQETSAGLVDWLKLVFLSKPDQTAGGEEWGSGDPEFHSKSTDIDGPHQASIIPQVRKVGFAAYKNWGVEGLDNGHRHKHYAIDVLVGSAISLEKERRLEVKHRSRTDAREGVAKWNSISSKPDQVSSLCPHPDEGQIQRVRIQSPAILATLAKAMGEIWPAAPRAFVRPFKALIHHHDKMKEALAQLEAKWANDDGDGEHSISVHPADDADGAETPRQRPVDDCVEALRDMRCYVAFVDKDILPLYHQFESCNRSSAQRRIRFDDLWYLFRTGELVYTPIATDSEKANPSSIRQSCWRVCGVYPPHPKHSKPNPWPHKHSRPSGQDDDGSSFSVSCYYIDYSGEDYGVVTEQFFIRPFEGEKDITTLNLFPFRFVEDSETMMEKFKKSGAEFLEYLERKHVSYNWWTITSNPRGDPVIDPDGNEVRHATHVNSDVIVDFVEAFRICPTWKPQTYILKPGDWDLQSRVDDIPIRQWSTDSDPASAYSQLPEIIQVHDGVEAMERNHHIESDDFLRQLLENEKSGRNTTAVHLPERNLLLLPKRMFAYILRDRKFAQLDHRYMRKPIVGGGQGFTDELKIPKGHKKTIEAIVNAHFMNRSTERQHGVEGLSQDLIPGKGRGRVILLHGVPGVGKTATAETVAQALAKPLFAITCGDLGITPKEVETSLNEIFRYAHLWDCVLLLDEVDTFFSHRMKPDLARNALVSVFLRVLEYFNGILFVTTNRVGALDEAFKSRIHLSLYYPPLDLPSFRDIWEMNIDRLKRIEQERCQSTDEPPLQIAEQEIMAFAMEHWHRHKHGQGLWNGRQIRNAFQIAWSLAYYDTRTEYRHETDAQGQSPPMLRARHFDTVSEATRLFDDYLAKAAGKTHPALAYERGERDDKYVYSHEEPYDYREASFAVPMPVPQQRHRGSSGTWNSNYRYVRGGSSGGDGVGYPGRPSLGADTGYDHPDAVGLSPHSQRQYYEGGLRRMAGYSGGQSPVPGDSFMYGASVALRGREEAPPSPFAGAMSMPGDGGPLP